MCIYYIIKVMVIMFGNVLKRLREARGIKQIDLAAALGKAKSTISMWESGSRIPDDKTLIALSQYFSVSVDTLLGTDNAPINEFYGIKSIIPLPATRKVPLIGSIACGTPIIATENIEDYINMPESIKADFCLRCNGDSMIGARIYDGDMVFISRQEDVDNGEIAAVLIGEEATLKRVYKSPQALMLQAENPAYEPFLYVGKDLENVRIIGKAVAFLSGIK